jgi:hypothetical protein
MNSCPATTIVAKQQIMGGPTPRANSGGPPSPPLPCPRQGASFHFSAHSVFRHIGATQCWLSPPRQFSAAGLLTTRSSLSPQNTYHDSLRRCRLVAKPGESSEISTVSCLILLQHIDVDTVRQLTSRARLPVFPPPKVVKRWGYDCLLLFIDSQASQP